MRSVWDRGLVRRFVGFDTPETVFSVDGFPIWDVVHIIAMTPWQMIRMIGPTNRAFDHYSKKAGRGSRKELFARWDKQRELIKLRAKPI